MGSATSCFHVECGVLAAAQTSLIHVSSLSILTQGRVCFCLVLVPKKERMVWVLKQGSQITSVQLGGWTWQVSAVSLQPHHLRFKTNTKKRCVEAWTWNRLTPFTPINLPLPLPKRFYNLSILIYGSYKPHYLYARLLPHYDHIRIEHTTLWGVPWASAARQKKTRCTWPTSKGRQKQNG